ncbi:MAG: Unknown protein [uncultured Sulfurovum sp.]|uniref:Uncharacterized protein n=1 Tax=uncultured Sulfurovum sp. TaxID=269237 RepID=A0A6S6UHE8_9BACT|nr:MAG: Unknown protein [uncultured Sulfurovum sp.]
MTLIKSSKSTVNFFKSLLIALILALTIAPIILLLSSANASWVFMATVLWSLGSLLIFHPFVVYVYPHLLSKMGVYLLTSILLIVSAWFNISMITLFLPYDYLYYGIFNATLTQISLWGSLYIILLNTIITNFILISNIDFYKEESLF